jgi:ferredoxin/flavodoxin
MRVDIYYFSGTGNTAWIVKRLAGRLAERGAEVVAASCEQVAGSDVDPAGCDVLGIAFPVHASFAPAVFRDFLAALPAGGGTPLFAVTTAGYAAGDTAWYAAQPLRAKGYDPFLLANVVVANNLRLPVLSPLPIPPQEELARRLERASSKIDWLAGRIHRRERYVEGAGLPGRLLGVTQRLSVGPFEKLAFQGFFAGESCTRCGWCVRHCPVHNIRMTGQGVEFLDRCMLCMRCYSFCPEQAIQSTHRTRDVERYPRYPGPEGRPYPSPSGL